MITLRIDYVMYVSMHSNNVLLGRMLGCIIIVEIYFLKSIMYGIYINNIKIQLKINLSSMVKKQGHRHKLKRKNITSIIIIFKFTKDVFMVFFQKFICRFIQN